jgi:hypothetical protein
MILAQQQILAMCKFWRSDRFWHQADFAGSLETPEGYCSIGLWTDGLDISTPAKRFWLRLRANSYCSSCRGGFVLDVTVSEFGASQCWLFRQGPDRSLREQILAPTNGAGCTESQGVAAIPRLRSPISTILFCGHQLRFTF